MAKANYSPWHVDEDSFSDSWTIDKKIRFLIRYAVLAPSGHNTQPWHFRIDNNDVYISANQSRYLPHSGIAAAEPYVSIGSAAETFLLAAKGMGLSFDIKYLPMKDSEVLKLSLNQNMKKDPTINQAIRTRTSNRYPFKKNHISSNLIGKIVGEKIGGIETTYYDERQDIEFLARQTFIATIEIMSDPKFRSELSKWVRSNTTNEHDGMPGFTQGMPLPPSLIAKHIIKNINISKGQAKTDSKRVLESAGIILICAAKRDKQSMLNAGRMYARIGVHAQQNGLATSGVGAAAIDPSTRKEIQRSLGLNASPVALMRIGEKTKDARHTPRWPAKKVTEAS